MDCPIEARLDALGKKLDLALVQLNSLLKAEEKMSQELDTLKTQVEENITLEGSIVTLVNGLAAQIEANKTDPAALTDMATRLKASADIVAAAVTANTPAAPAS